MRYEAYYLIEGRSELRSHPELDPVLAEALCEPVLFQQTEGGLWRGPTPPDFEARARLTFLMRLKQDRAESDFLARAPLDLAFFDLYWSIQAVSEKVSAEDILRRVEPRVLEGFIPTGDPFVDDFIEGLRQTKLETAG